MTTAPQRRYSFFTPDEVRARIRKTLEPLGEVEEIRGDIVIMDGDYVLDDVHAIVAGRTVACVRSESGIDYHVDGARLDLNALLYGPSSASPTHRSLAQILHDMFKEADRGPSHGRWDALSGFMFLVFVASFLALGTLLVMFLASLFDNDAPMSNIGWMLLGSAVLTFGSVALGVYSDDRSKPDYAALMPKYRPDLLRETVRFAKKNRVSYAGNLHVVPVGDQNKSYRGGPSVRFTGLSSGGTKSLYETDGVGFHRIVKR